MSQFLEKSLPSSPDSERTILGAILLDNNLIHQVSRQLQPNDFYSPLHRRVFQAMVKLYMASSPIDPVSIGEKLRDTNQLENLGGIAAITNLTYGLPHFSDVRSYIEIVKNKSKARDLLKTANRISEKCLAEEENIKETIQWAEAEIFKFNDFGVSDGFSSFHSIAESEIESVVTYVKENKILRLPQTGFSDLDTMLGGIDNELIILAARPSMGKSAFAMNVAEDIVENNGVVLVFSLEMSKEMLMYRIICARTGIPYNRVKIRNVTQAEAERLREEVWKFTQSEFHICDTPGITALDILSETRRFIVEHKKKPDLVVVDYLQLMNASQRSQNIREQVTFISKELAAVRKLLGCPLLVISSLSRANETGSTKPRPPRMSDLRESGQIEFDADKILLLHREGYYDQSVAEPNTAQLEVAKNKNGETGIIKLFWEREKTRFRNHSGTFG